MSRLLSTVIALCALSCLAFPQVTSFKCVQRIGSVSPQKVLKESSLRKCTTYFSKPDASVDGNLANNGRFDADRHAPSSLLLNIYKVSLIGLPLLSGTLPWLLSRVTDFQVAPAERGVDIICLLVLKRAYLYLVAFSTLLLIVERIHESSQQSSGFGQRLMLLNEEILGVRGTSAEQNNTLTAAYSALDKQVTDDTLPYQLPLALGAALTGTFLTIRYVLPGLSVGASSLPPQWLQYLSAAPVAAVTFLFARTELRHVFRQQPAWLGPGAAALLVLLAFALPPSSDLWPIHNVLNTCIAVTFARAVAVFARLPQLALTLAVLAGYDLAAVRGTRMLTDSGQSIMEAVARARLSLDATSTARGALLPDPAIPSVASSQESVNVLQAVSDYFMRGSNAVLAWRPGLFEVHLNHAVSDALGLADVIFPALLALWARQYDQNRPSGVSHKGSAFASSLVGFAVGCLACELSQTGAGQPALVYIVPAMLGSLMLYGVRNKEIRDMWR
eukprot:gene28016-33831_t